MKGVEVEVVIELEVSGAQLVEDIFFNKLVGCVWKVQREGIGTYGEVDLYFEAKLLTL